MAGLFSIKSAPPIKAQAHQQLTVVDEEEDFVDVPAEDAAEMPDLRLLKRSIEIKKLLADGNCDEGPPELAAKLLPHQQAGLFWMVNREKETQGPKGGILADEQGLGKTVQTIALMLRNLPPPEDDDDDELPPLRTLVVAPVALLQQWKEELQRFSRRPLNIEIHHGPERSKDPMYLVQQDVVITSYKTLELDAEVTQLDLQDQNNYRISRGLSPLPASTKPRPKGPLFKVMWFRVVLDEASGNIRNHTTAVSKACSRLIASRRWCLTGTPIENSLLDLYALFRFLKFQPYNEFSRFTRDFMQRRGRLDFTDDCIKRIQAVMEGICLRRTKDTKLEDGRRLLELPDRNISFVRATFSPHESDFYQAVEYRAQLRFNAYLQEGTVMRNYSHAFELLLRMRQACLHPLLTCQRTLSESQMHLQALIQRGEREFNLNSSVLGALSRIAGGNLDDSDEEEEDEELPDVFGTSASTAKAAAAADAAAASSSSDNKKASVKWLQPGVLARLQQQDVPETCPACLDPPRRTEALVSPCGHVICRECISLFGASIECPTCRASFSKSKMVPGELCLRDFEKEERERKKKERQQLKAQAKKSVAASIQAATAAAASNSASSAASATTSGGANSAVTNKKLTVAEELELRRKENLAERKAVEAQIEVMQNRGFLSTKLVKLLEIVRDARAESSGKIIVFTSFTQYFSFITETLKLESVGYVLYEGSMSSGARHAAVEQFKTDDHVQVMVASLKCAAYGLNLTVACHAIILDPWWNPSLEMQAIDRIHRIGQENEVKVTRIIVDGTVEDRILELQEGKKKSAINGTQSRLTLNDLKSLFTPSRTYHDFLNPPPPPPISLGPVVPALPGALTPGVPAGGVPPQAAPPATAHGAMSTPIINRVPLPPPSTSRVPGPPSATPGSDLAEVMRRAIQQVKREAEPAMDTREDEDVEEEVEEEEAEAAGAGAAAPQAAATGVFSAITNAITSAFRSRPKPSPRPGRPARKKSKR